MHPLSPVFIGDCPYEALLCDMRIMGVVASLRPLLEIVIVRFPYHLRQLRFGSVLR